MELLGGRILVLLEEGLTVLNLRPQPRLLLARHVQQLVQLDTGRAEHLVLRDEGADELHELRCLGMVVDRREGRSTERDRTLETILDLGERVLTLARTKDLVLAHLLEILDRTLQSLLHLDDPLSLLLDASLGHRRPLALCNELLASVLCSAS